MSDYDYLVDLFKKQCETELYLPENHTRQLIDQKLKALIAIFGVYREEVADLDSPKGYLDIVDLFDAFLLMYNELEVKRALFINPSEIIKKNKEDGEVEIAGLYLGEYLSLEV